MNKQAKKISDLLRPTRPAKILNQVGYLLSNKYYFSTQKSYLKATAEWKQDYKEFSQEQRRLKQELDRSSVFQAKPYGTCLLAVRRQMKILAAAEREARLAEE
jgi:hypothetical protein